MKHYSFTKYRRSTPIFLLAAMLASATGFITVPAWAQEGISIPAPDLDEPAGQGKAETAIVAGGCFWGVQGVFQRVDGVTNAVSGYAGGESDTAHYEMVGSGSTGHAESVKVTFDPSKISYGKILQVFFSVAHDPTN